MIMREIKFRVFDKKSKKMNPVKSIWGFPDVQSITIPVEETVETLFYNFELMQYTGLKDKNETDIYEGDIVKKVIELEGGVVNIWEVFFGEAGFDIRRTKEDGKETTMYLKKYWKNTYEVIGNIHENPELLK